MLSCRPTGTSVARLPAGITRLFCALILLATVPRVYAGSWQWNGGGGNTNWSSGANWGGSAPTSGATTDLIFAGTTNTGTLAAPLNQDINSLFKLKTITFNLGGGSFFLGGGALSFAGAANSITQNSSSAQSIANAITASAAGTINLTLAGTGSGIVTLSGPISSSGSKDYALIKSGTSTFTLSGANGYGGLTTINGGVLNIQNAQALGATSSGTTVASGAALQIQNNIIVGAETLTLNGSGIANDGAFRNISGTNSFGGAITFGSASTIASDSGTLTLSGTVNNGGFLFTESGAGNVTISGVISGAGGLTKNGTGTLTLNGAAVNAYTGATTVNQGTLVLATAARSTAGPAITIGGAGNTATVQLGANFQIYGANTTISSQGQLNLNNFQEYVGSLTLNGGAVVTGTGLLYIGGTGITSSANSVTSTLTGNYSFATATQTFNIASGTTPSGTDVIISGSIGEFNVGTTVTKQGAGKIVLSGANAWKGLTTISAGVLNIQNASALGTIDAGTTVSSGAALQIEGGIAVGNEALTLNGGGISSDGALRNVSGNNSYAGGITLGSASTINSDAGTLTLNGGIVNGGFTVTFGGASNVSETGVISGTGALVKNGSGTLTLSGTNTFSGGSTINGGTVIVYGSSLGASTGVANLNAATIDVAATVTSTRNFVLGDATSTLMVDPTFTFTANGIFSGSGALNKTGSGTMVLGSGNTYTGATNVTSGTLQVNANNALGTSASGTTVSNGAVLTLNNVNYSTAESLTLNGSGISNGGALRNSGTSTFAGSITAATNATINAGGGTLNLTGGVSKNGTTLTISGGGTVNITTNGITGSLANSDLIVDGVTVNENVANSYNGPTYIRGGGILNANVANALPTANGRSAVILDDSGTGSSQLVLGAPQSAASLTGASSSLVNLNGNTLTIGTSAGTTTFAGVISGTGGLTKDGASTQTLSGANTYSGATTINTGTLTLANSSGNALGSTGSITVNSGGTLALGQSNQINNTATVTLAGGTFAKSDFSEGSVGSAGVGALTLTASGSHLDFGTGTVGVLTFASLTPGSFNLTIDNWTGTANTQGTGSTDRLIFASDQSGNLGSFSFTGYSGAVEFALPGGYWEVTPVVAVPEMSTWVAAALALGVAGSHLLRRRLVSLPARLRKSPGNFPN